MESEENENKMCFLVKYLVLEMSVIIESMTFKTCNLTSAYSFEHIYFIL